MVGHHGAGAHGCLVFCVCCLCYCRLASSVFLQLTASYTVTTVISLVMLITMLLPAALLSAAGQLGPVEVPSQCDGQCEEGRSDSGAVGSQGSGSSSRRSQGRQQQQAGRGSLIADDERAVSLFLVLVC